ncbi:MAG: hypothetical protein SO093_00910, partial [Desulfovibrio sp.]|uniref:hypothetical protein n=1 Tax=Desulfovibrio sp. TaxID=885 RepID=UPI002A827DD9
PTAHQAHHENLFVSWDEITTPFKIKKHAGHPLKGEARFVLFITIALLFKGLKLYEKSTCITASA